MSYQLNRAHLLICIFAALVLAGGFVWHLFFGVPVPLFRMAMWVSGGIIIFYIIGTFARSILIQKVFVPEPEYDFSQDEEYQAFMESLETEAGEPEDVMSEEPIQEYDDSLQDPFMEELEEAS